MPNYRIAGIQNGTTKDNKTFHVLHLFQAFDDPKDGLGSAVSKEFVFDTKLFDVSKLKPGDTVALTYSKGYDGKAYLCDVSLVQALSDRK